MIHVQPLTSILRLYKEGSYEERSPYDAVATITYLDTETVYISGLHGKISIPLLRELVEHLLACGVKEIHMDRHGKHKVLDITTLL